MKYQNHAQETARRFVRRALSRSTTWRKPPDEVAWELIQTTRGHIMAIFIAFKQLFRAFRIGWNKGWNKQTK
jgi:hypothetical protein